MKLHLYTILALMAIIVMTAGLSNGAEIRSSGLHKAWSDTLAWEGNVLPGPGDDVVIVDRDTVTYDMNNVEIANLTVGTGADSCLFRPADSMRTSMTITGNIVVNAKAAFKVQTCDTAVFKSDLFHRIFIYGNITNYGTFDMRTGKTSSTPHTLGVINYIFLGSQNSVITMTGPYSTSNNEFNAVRIIKTGGANLVLGSDMYMSGGSSTASVCDDTLAFVSGKVITGDYTLFHLGTASAQILGASDSTYVVGALARGLSNTSAVTKTLPIGDEFGYRPFKVGASTVGGATGHHVIVRCVHSDANTGSSVLVGGIDKVSQVRYYQIKYRVVVGATDPPAPTMNLDIFAPNYGLDDGVRTGNRNLRVAYSVDGRQTWTKIPMKDSGSTNLNTLPKMLTPDTLRPGILMDTLSSVVYVAFADTGGSNPLDGTLPQFSITSHTLSFGDVNIGQEKWDSLEVTNPGTGALTIRSHTEVDSLEFETSPPAPIVIEPGASQMLRFKFAPNTPGIRTSRIYIYHDAPHNPDTMNVSGVGITFDSMMVSFNARWNLMSVPLVVLDDRKDSLYPGSISNAFYYDGSYQVAANMENGIGYWLKFPSADSVQVVGNSYMIATIAVRSGWNLIGTIDTLIAADSIVATGTTVLSPYYAYANAYTPVTVLAPGKGYWVKVSQPGTLTLTKSGLSVNAATRKDANLRKKSR